MDPSQTEEAEVKPVSGFAESRGGGSPAAAHRTNGPQRVHGNGRKAQYSATGLPVTEKERVSVPMSARRTARSKVARRMILSPVLGRNSEDGRFLFVPRRHAKGEIPHEKQVFSSTSRRRKPSDHDRPAAAMPLRIPARTQMRTPAPRQATPQRSRSFSWSTTMRSPR